MDTPLKRKMDPPVSASGCTSAQPKAAAEGARPPGAPPPDRARRDTPASASGYASAQPKAAAEAACAEAALSAEELLRCLKAPRLLASLLVSPDSPQQLFACVDGGFAGDGQRDAARSALEALFDEAAWRERRESDPGEGSDDAEHCSWVFAAFCVALPLLSGVLPRDQCGACIIPHPHPLKKVVLDGRRARYSQTGVVHYFTGRACDNCDCSIEDKEYWCCGWPKASGGNCSVDFCCRCYNEMQALFATCNIEDAMWVVRFVSAAAKHVLVSMNPAARQLLVRRLAFELPLPIFERLVRVVVDVTDAGVIHIEDNINDVSEFEDFWLTLGLLDLLHAANLLPTTERGAEQVFLETARLPGEHFILQGIDKCEVYSDWKRWRLTMAEDVEQPNIVLTGNPFKADAHFTCFLSHGDFVPGAFLRRAVEFDALPVGEAMVPRRLEFRRQPEGFRDDVIADLGYCFQSGQLVRMRGLVGAAELNGKEGVLGTLDRHTGRWSVTVGESGGEGEKPTVKSLKLANLEHADEDALLQTLRQPVDPRFAGENGSGPGVVREFCLLALQALVACPEYWEYNEEVRTYWFSGSTTPAAVAAARAVGLIMGNAIVMGLLLPGVFPEPLYAMLLLSLGSSRVGKWSLADLRKVSPAFARSFEHFMEYDKDDIASVFTLDWPRGAEMATLPKDERAAYVQDYVEWFFNDRFQVQAEALFQGFGALFGKSSILRKLVSVEQFSHILHGKEEPLDVCAVRRGSKEVGWSGEEEQRYLEQFWEVLAGFNEEQLRKLAIFVSSSARAPLKGWSDFGLQVQKNGRGDDRWPTAYTCFHLLLLPIFSSADLMRARLLHAIDETQGFGLY